MNDTSFLFGVALCWTLLLLLFFGSWIFWVEVELQQRLLNRWDLTLLLRKWLLLQQQVSLLELHLRAEGSSDSTRLCLDIFQMCIGHFLLCTLHKLMIGTQCLIQIQSGILRGSTTHPTRYRAPDKICPPLLMRSQICFFLFLSLVPSHWVVSAMCTLGYLVFFRVPLGRLGVLFVL